MGAVGMEGVSGRHELSHILGAALGLLERGRLGFEQKSEVMRSIFLDFF